VTVLALAATAAWFIAVRQHEPLPGDDAVAPDFTAEPVLTELVDLAGVFPGVSALQVEGFLDDTTMLVSSRPGTAIGDSNWYQGYEEDYERGAADAERFDEDYSTWHICVNSSCDGPDCVDRECVEPNRDDYFDYDNYGDFGYQDGYDGNRREVPPAAGEDSTTFLAAVSMDSPTEPKWKLDLNEALGEDALYFDCGYVSLAIDGRGNSLFSVGTEFDALEGDCYWVAVGSGGELLSWARVAPDAIRYAQVVDGLALMDLGGNEYRSRVGAYRLEDLESPVWEADCGGFGCHLATVNGEAWVVTDQGVVDLATGRDVGFDRRLQDWELIVGDGDALFVLDWAGDSEYGGITRAGLDGEDVWDAAVPTSDMVVEVGDGRAYVPRGEAMVGVDAETGEERWSTAVGQVIWFCVAGNGNLAVALAADADRLAIIDGESGEVLGDGLPGVLMACGEEMVYATDADGNAQARLVGYSAQAGQAGQAAPDADGRELWSVALPEGASTVPLMTPGQRMYYVAAQYGAEAGMGNGNGSRREAEALRLDSLIVYRVDHK
jgi:hypothetical protein